MQTLNRERFTNNLESNQNEKWSKKITKTNRSCKYDKIIISRTFKHFPLHEIGFLCGYWLHTFVWLFNRV